jgi:kelch-like protein 10
MTTTDEEIPTPKFALQRVHDILFVFGGGFDYVQTADFFEYYSTRADRWTKTEEFGLTRGLESQCAAVIGFDIHVIGGREDDDRVLNSCRCFNAVTKTWRDVAPMKYRRYRHCVAVLGDVLYVMGGADDDNSTLKTAERYDSKTDRWTSIADLRVRRVDASATALNGKIYVVGGNSYDVTLRSAEVYDPRTNRWTLISDMRIGRAYLSCVAFHGCVYAIGGETEINPDVSVSTSSGEKYDPETDTWTSIPDMSMKRWDMATAVIDDKIFVIGGTDCKDKPMKRVECFNDEENEWCEATGMRTARYRPCAVVVSGLPNVNDYIDRRNGGGGDDDENDDYDDDDDDDDDDYDGNMYLYFDMIGPIETYRIFCGFKG